MGSMTLARRIVWGVWAVGCCSASADEIGASPTPSSLTDLLHLASARAVPSDADALLPDGRHLKVTADGVWLVSTQAHMTQIAREGRLYASASLLPDGRVLVWGGIDSTGKIQATGLWFDTASDSVEPAAIAALVPTAGHTATVVTDGRLLVVGGWSTDGWQRQARSWDPRHPLATQPAVTTEARFGASATLLANGQVAVVDGVEANGQPATSPLQIDASEAREVVASPIDDVAGASPTLAASVPANEAVAVALDAWTALRFSQPVVVTTLTSKSVTLIGPSGPTPIDVTPTESGRLAFVRPREELLPNSRYTVFVDGAKTMRGTTVPFTTVTFQTRVLSGTSTTSSGPTPTRAEPASGVPAQSRAPRTATTPPKSLVAIHLTTGTAAALAVAHTHCESKNALHGYTFCHDEGSVQNGIFTPGFNNTGARWRLNSPLPTLVKESDFPAGTFAAGETAVFGTVRRIDNQPLDDVTVTIGTASTRSDRQGHFVLKGVSSGHQIISIDGTTASRSHEEYGQFLAAIDIKAQQANATPFNLYVPRITALDKVTIASPTQTDTVITHPGIPGLEIHVPAGTVFRDTHGKIITEFAIVPMPVDRSPVPVPANFPAYFSMQPGGATVEGLNAVAATGLRVVYPNYTDSKQTGQGFWYYDVDHSGWKVYLTGHLSDDGRAVQPD